MGKTFDKVGASLLLLLISFLIFFRAIRSVALSAVCALLVLVAVILFLSFLRPRSPKNLLSKRNFIRYVLLKGNGELKTLVENALPQTFTAESAGDHTLLRAEPTVLLYYAYKFGSLSEEDVAKSYRLAQKFGAEEIYALTNHLDRKALAVAEYIPQKFNVVNVSTIYKYLLKKGFLPKKDALPKKSGKAFRFMKTLFKSDNVKYYVWAGLTTALLALFTPITTYYIAFSFINLALAVITMVLSERSDGENRLFKA